MSASEDSKELRCCYSVGSYGPFPISFYSRGGKYFYAAQEYDEMGPYGTLANALGEAAFQFGATAGGFWGSLREAKRHADSMRNQGYSVE